MAGAAGEYFGNVGDLDAGTLSAIYLTVFIGGITFTGSIVTCKLSGMMSSKALALPIRDQLNLGMIRASRRSRAGLRGRIPRTKLPTRRRGAERRPSTARRRLRPSRADVKPMPLKRRRTSQASTTMRSRAAGAAVPPLPRPSPTRPMSTTTRLRAAGTAVPPRHLRQSRTADASVPRSSSKPSTKTG